MALTKHRVALEPGHKCSALKYVYQCQAEACFVSFYFLENTAAQMLWSPAYLTQNFADL